MVGKRLLVQYADEQKEKKPDPTAQEVRDLLIKVTDWLKAIVIKGGASWDVAMATYVETSELDIMWNERSFNIRITPAWTEKEISVARAVIAKSLQSHA